MDFKDLFNELSNVFKEKELDKYNSVDFENNFFGSIVFDAKKEYFFKRIASEFLNKFGSISNIKDAFIKGNADESTIKNIESSLRSGYVNSTYRIYDLLDVPKKERIVSFDNKTVDEIMEHINSFINKNPNEKEKIESIINNNLSKSLSSGISLSLENESSKDIIFNVISNNISIDEQEKIKDEAILNGEKSIEENEVAKTHNKELTELKNKAKNEEEKELIDHLDNEILITNKGITSDYSKLAETSAKEYKKEELNSIIAEFNNDKYLKETFFVNGFNIIATTDEYKKSDPKELRDYIKENDVKITFSENTKNILKEGLEYLNSLKDIDGNDLLDINTYSQEEGNKVYALKNLTLAKKKASDIIKGNSENKIEELGKVEKFYNKSIEEYDHLIDIVKKLDTNGFPANISVSRNPNMPLKYIKDYKNVSLMNGLWHTLAMIKNTGSTIDEYLNNPVEIENKYNKQFSNFSMLNETCKKYSELDVINSFIGEMPVEEIDKVSNKVGSKSSTFRFMEFASMIDKENAKQNQTAYGIYYGAVIPDISRAYNEFKNKFNNKETIKNVLIFDSKEINYPSLVSKDEKIYDPVTGEKLNHFDYQQSLNKSDLNTSVIDEKIKKIEKSLNDRKYGSIKDIVNESIKEVSLDIIKNKSIEDISNIESFMNRANITCVDYLKIKRGNSSSVDYAKNILSSNSIDNLNDKNKLKETLFAYKAINDKYNNRGFFSKHLLTDGRKEGKAIIDFEKYFKEINVDKEKIDNFLNGKTTLDSITNDIAVTNKNEIISEPLVISEKDLNNNKNLNDNLIIEESLNKEPEITQEIHQ